MNTTTEKPQIVIIGAGPTGLYAAQHAGQMGMRPVLVEALSTPGGQCAALYPSDLIHDAPATPAITGQELTHNLLSQLEDYEPLILLGRRAVSVWGSLEGGFNVETDTGETITGAAVIYAGGAGAMQPRRLHAPGVSTLNAGDISYGQAETTGRRVAVVGDGEDAIDAALSAASTARAVTLIHDGPLAETGAKSVALREAARSQRFTVVNGQIDSITAPDGRLSRIAVTVGGNRLDQPADLLLVQAGLEFAPEPVTGLAAVRDTGTGETDIRGMFVIGDALAAQAGLTGRPPVIAAGFSEASRAARAAAIRVIPGAARAHPAPGGANTPHAASQVA